jgi:hypothetical protein
VTVQEQGDVHRLCSDPVRNERKVVDQRLEALDEGSGRALGAAVVAVVVAVDGEVVQQEMRGDVRVPP